MSVTREWASVAEASPVRRRRSTPAGTELRKSVKWTTAVVVASALVTACGGGAAATAAKPSAPVRPVTKYRNTLPGLKATAPIDLIQTIFAFAPGAASTVHEHPSANLATVLQGQITVKMATGDRQAKAGEALSEPLNQHVQAVNTGPAEALVAVAFTVLHGTKPTVPVAGQPAPGIPNKALYTFTLNSPSISGGYSLMQQVLDFAPGSSTAKHHHGGPGVITVIQGSVVLNTDGKDQTFSTGQSFTELPGHTLQAFNRGSSDAIVVATFLVPDGAQLTTNLA
jgi:quercetin dioxygenase-like cupin family protein